MISARFLFAFLIVSSIAGAEPTYYKTILSNQHLHSRVTAEPYKECSKEFKSYQCEEFETDKVTDSDLLFDCKLKGAECQEGEQVVTIPLGFKYRFVGYLKFSQSEICKDIDPFPPARPALENLKMIVNARLAKGENITKAYEAGKYYLSIPYTNAQKQKVDRSSCLTYSRGWIMDIYIKKTPRDEILSPLKREAQSICGDLDEADCKKNMLADTQALAQTLLDRAQNEVKMERRNIGDKLQRCNGEIELPSIKFKLKKVGKECKFEFPKNCGKSDYAYLEKVEQIANTIILSAPEKNFYNEKCKTAKNDFALACGVQDVFDKRFSKAYEKVIRTLSTPERANYQIHPGYLMCIYARETFENKALAYSPASINFEVCKQDTVGLRNPGFENPNDPVLTGKISSANGLGGVTLTTACETIKTFRKKVSKEVFEQNYPDVNAELISAADCKTPQAKKLVEDTFNDRSKQVQLSVDALRYKLDITNGNMSSALAGYGDKNNLNYVPFVNACARDCFIKGLPIDGKSNPNLIPPNPINCVENKLRLLPHKPAVGKEVKGDIQ